MGGRGGGNIKHLGQKGGGRIILNLILGTENCTVNAEIFQEVDRKMYIHSHIKVKEL